MPDLLLEIGTEEMPVELLSPMAVDFSLRVDRALAENGSLKGGIRALYTPRRLALVASDVSIQASDDEERINTISRILGEAVNELVSEGAMHRDSSPVMFIRSIRYVVCLYGKQVIPLRVGNVVADRQTRAHWRSAAGAEIALSSPADYEQVLAAGGVIVDQERRKQMMTDAITAAASEANVSVQVDDSLLARIADGVEYPQPVIGRLKLPPDLPAVFVKAVLREAGFVPLDVDQGNAAPFVGFADGSVDGDVVRAGYERAARSVLRGCRLLYTRDREASLADHVGGLRNIGDEVGVESLWEKTERLRTLSGQVAQALDTSVGTVDRAAFLCQADLATWIVREFPSLHGIAGAVYAKLDGEESSVCMALEEGAVSNLERGGIPASPEGLAIAIAQRYDHVATLLLTGNETYAPQVVSAGDDLIGLMIGGKVDLDLVSVLGALREQYRILSPAMMVEDLEGALRACLKERLIDYLETKQEVTSRIASALPETLRSNPYRSSACALGLQEASSKEGFALLLGSFAKLRTHFRAGNKRVFDPALFEEETERGLWREYLKAEGKMEGLLAELDYEQAIDQLTSLSGAIDRYAEDVDLGAGSEEIRNNRFGLIASIVDLYARVRDFAALLETDGYAPGEEKK